MSERRQVRRVGIISSMWEYGAYDEAGALIGYFSADGKGGIVDDHDRTILVPGDYEIVATDEIAWD